MENKGSKYKWLKWLGGIVGVCILIVAGVVLYFNAKWKPLLTAQIKEGVYSGSKHLYRIDFKDIRLNLLSGTIVLDELTLAPDTLVYNQMKKARLAPVHLFQIKLERLQVNRVSVLKAYFKKQIDLSSIVLDQPSIHVIHHQVSKRPDTLKGDSTLYQQISKSLKSIHVGVIKIIDADVDYINGTTQKPLHSIKHFNMNVKELLIDSLSQYDTSRFCYAKDVDFELTNIRSTGKDKMYTIKVDTIKGSVTGKTIRIKGFQMIPLYPDLAFTRKYKYGKDRYDMKFDHIELEGINFLKLNADAELEVKALRIGPAKVAIFVNRELPSPPNLDKANNFPHIALKRLQIPLTIDAIQLKNVDIAYTEYNPISQKRGTLFFDNLSGNIANVTNDSSRLVKNNHAIANLNALVMKTSKIKISIDFNLTDKLAAFSYKGQVGPMDLTILNPMTKNMGLVEIESGKMQRTDFDIQANAKGLSGTVHFLYHNLKVKLLKEGEHGAQPKKKGFLSFLANKLLIDDDNPSKGEAVRVAKVTFERSPAASFFNLLWKGVFIGMRESVGLGVVPVKSPEQSMKQIKDKKEARKNK